MNHVSLSNPQLRFLLVFVILLYLLIPLHSSYCNEISILYWNNRHAHSLPDTEIIDTDTIRYGGVATLAGMVNLFRAISPQTLTFVVGNSLSGSAVAAKSAGLSEIKVLNEIGIDAFTPGVRAFGYGVEPLLKTTKKADFPILLFNCVNKEKNEALPLFIPDTVYERNGVKIAVVGLIDEHFTELVAQDGVIGLSSFNQVTAAKEFVMKRRSSCDFLIALTYMGWKNDSLLAASVGGLDLIIGSGDYLQLDPAAEVNGVMITQAGAYGHQLGRIIVDVDTAMNEVVDFKSEILQVTEGAAVPDKGIRQIVQRQHKKLSDGLNNTIGYLATDWDHVTDGQSNLAQWIADMTRYIEPRAWASVINNRDIQAGVKSGKITELDMWNICPYENVMIVFRVSGKELMSMAQYQLMNNHTNLTWGGIRLKARKGKIESLTIKDEKVFQNRYYLITTTGSVWERFESTFGIDPYDRPYFALPGVNQRDKLIEAVTNLRTVGAPMDDRWDVEE